MKLSTVALFLAAAISQTEAAPQAAKAKTPYFILTGDSTVASNAGWGDAFLKDLKSPSAGTNPAVGGATTVSFKAQGRWATAIKAVKDNAANYEPIVTIQFGHNDQKSDSGISLAQFTTNLKTLANEVKAAGGTPILITSLSRRTFKGGKVVQNLEDQRQAAITAAGAVGAQYLDLNIASTNYINAIGSDNAQSYNYVSGDTTHLNAAGKVVFSRLVADLLLEKRADLSTYITANKALSDKIKAGQFATGSE